IEQRAVAHLGMAGLLRELGRDGVQVPHQFFVFGGKVVERRNVLAWDDEHMEGRLRRDVGKGNAQLVLVRLLRRNLAIADLAKQTIEHGGWFRLLREIWQERISVILSWTAQSALA